MIYSKVQPDQYNKAFKKRFRSLYPVYNLHKSDFDEKSFIFIKNGKLITEGSKKQPIKLNAKNLYPNSLGLFYSAVTDFLGWKHHCDEGIIMGLAPYGDPHENIPKTNKSYIEVFDDILVEKNEYEFEIISGLKLSEENILDFSSNCLLYTSPSPRDQRGSGMPAYA